MWHYTTADNLERIRASLRLNPSLRENNPRDARYGDGQYLTDIPPSTLTGPQLSRRLVHVPFRAERFTHYLEVDVTGLEVVRGREHVFVIPSREPLDLTGRIVSWGPKNGEISQGAVAPQLPRGSC
ncbi:HYD1 signature containing ADP-ribosyltransferase family protein [Nonomuraea sp. NPDC049709]|uniref:HYD1 signature containing ADP-ribosyltransferase family protein n=1 Tax=Nonomuraea sp. NPDC049709 TaxID=3154736 RepID=UPI003417E27B